MDFLFGDLSFVPHWSLVGDPVDPVGDLVDLVGDPVDSVGDQVDPVGPALIPWRRFAPLTY